MAANDHRFGAALCRSSHDTVRLGSSRRRRLMLLIAAAMVLVAGRWSASAYGQGAGYPRPEYYAAFIPFREGEFRDALQSFRIASRTGLRSGEGQWIDGICYHTMMGECLYQMGDPAAALHEFTLASGLFLQHRNWLMAVQFPSAIGRLPDVGPPVPWGQKTRRGLNGDFPSTANSGIGQIDQTDVLQQGGVVRLAQYITVDATEVARCIALTLRRRAELLGPNAQYDRMTGQLISVLSARPGQSNHWSMAWVECWVGMAYLASNRPLEAASSLQTSLLVAGQYDHPLTAQALLELGKLAFHQGDYEQAGYFFYEASFPAVAYEQYELLEEAFRWGAQTHIIANQGGIYPHLNPVIAWAQRKPLGFISASLTLEVAEQLLSSDLAAATATLERTRRLMNRRQMSAGLVGGRFQYILALANFQAGNNDAAQAALATALKFQQKSGLWLFQLGLANKLATSGAVTERAADELYALLLREPTPTDWLVRPLDSLAAWTTPNAPLFEQWLEMSLRRNEGEKAMELADRIRRRHFLLSLPLGGRVLALRWVLEAPDILLSNTARQQRQALRAKYPNYDALARRVAELRDEMPRMSIIPENAEKAEQQSRILAELGKLSAAQEQILLRMAVGRDAAEFVFPPVYDVKLIQQHLTSEQVLLSYYNLRGVLLVFKVTKNEFQLARIPGANRLRGEIANLLRQMGNLDAQFAIGPKELADETWKTTSQNLFRLLTAQRADAETTVPWQGCRELIIVPDGPLWYLPFEATPIANKDETLPLLAKVRVRYLPLHSLAVPDQRPQRPTAETVVLAGKMHPRDPAEATQLMTSALADVLPGVRRFTGTRVPTTLLAPFCDRLVVLTQVDEHIRRGPLGFAPWPGDANGVDGSLSAWLSLPWGAPLQIVLPSFVTYAEISLKKGGTGEEMFLSTCGLMAAGTRSILISRWRVGGNSTARLITEYVQELPHTSPANAWQRAVQLIRSEDLDLLREPRVNGDVFTEPVSAGHPLFWSGYMLVDAGQPEDKAELPPQPPAMDAPPEKDPPEEDAPAKEPPPLAAPLGEPLGEPPLAAPLGEPPLAAPLETDPPADSSLQAEAELVAP